MANERAVEKTVGGAAGRLWRAGVGGKAMVYKQKGLRRRRRLFDVAARLFAERGYHGTSLQDLAREMGLKKSSLYHYMSSKEDLLFQLLDEHITVALEEIQGLAPPQAPPLVRLQGFLRFYTRFYASDRHRLILLVNELDNLSPAHRQVLVAKQRRYLEAIEDILAGLRREGLMKEIPPAVAAFAFFGMVHYTYKWFRPAGSVDYAELGEYFQEIFTRGVLA